MKINSVSQNCSFKALMLEKKHATKSQKKIIKNIKDSILKDKYYIHLLESRYSDIYISPNKDGKSVDLKLLTAAGLTYNFVPKDKDGGLSVNIHVPEQILRNNNEAQGRLRRNVELRTQRFLKRSIDCIFDCLDNLVNTERIKHFDNLSMSDLAKNEIQQPDIIPNAKVIYGEPAVTTRK